MNSEERKKSLGSTGQRGMIGVHLVAGELGRRRWIPLLTEANVPQVDIVAMAPDYSKTVLIQVKALKSTNRNSQGKPGWMIKEENILDKVCYVLVEIPVKDEAPPRYFILNAQEARAYCDHYKINSICLPRSAEAGFLNKWDKVFRFQANLLAVNQLPDPVEPSGYSLQAS